MSINNQLSSTESQASYPQKSEKIVEKRKKYRRFNWIFLLSAFLPIVGVGIFNIVVDPYDVFNTPNFLGINHLKPRKLYNDRLYKATDIIHIKPVTILIGSSRTKQGLDPNHPALENEQPAYNLALNGSNIYELRRYIEHAISNHQSLDLVIVGLYFLMFNSLRKNRVSFSERRLEKQYILFKDFINVAFSFDALQASKETIIYSKKTPTEYLGLGYGENGFTPRVNLDPEKTQQRFTANILPYYQGPDSRHQLSTEFLDELKKIVDLSEKNQINLMLFIYLSLSCNSVGNN